MLRGEDLVSEASLTCRIEVFACQVRHACHGLPTPALEKRFFAPVSSEISDLCEISDLLLFVSYFASQSKGMKLGDCFFDVCYAH